MTEAETKLRLATNNLILIITFNERMKHCLEDFEALLSISDYEQRFFENPVTMKAFVDTKTGLYDNFERFKKTFGSDTISRTYEAFKTALADPAFCAEIGIDKELTKADAAALFNAVFQKLMETASALPEETDGYTVFVDLLRETMTDKTALAKGSQDTCPYCDGIPSRIPKSDFFGKSTDDSDGYVWACDCGAYARIALDGSVLGTMADRALHASRKTVRKAMYDLCFYAGITVYESCAWLGWTTGKMLRNPRDIEFMDEEDCAKAIAGYEGVKKRIGTLKVKYPENHTELMAFLRDGGRMSVINAYGYRNGRLLVPVQIGDEVIRVRFKKVVQDVALPEELEYRFDGNVVTLRHPSGKQEKYRLHAKEARLELYKEEKDV